VVRPFTFRLLGFPVTVQVGFLLFIGVIALYGLEARSSPVSVALWCAVITVSLVVHELGHALVARRLGVRVFGIELAFMHGTASHQRTTHQRQLLISLAGPAAGFGLAVLALGGLAAVSASGLSPGGGHLPRVLDQLVYVNVLYGVFNLLPMLPLDGGNALRSALAWGTNANTALRVVGVIGAACAIGVVLFGMSTGMYFLAALAGFLAWTNIQALQQSGILR
jgi:stage IV sporulation protein FB